LSTNKQVNDKQSVKEDDADLSKESFLDEEDKKKVGLKQLEYKLKNN
jgi:hypothetical protein